LTAAVFAAVALALVQPLTGAVAQSPSPTRSPSPTPTPGEPQEPPRLVYESVEDGDVLDQDAFVLQLCFEAPINIRDQSDGGDFEFVVRDPEGRGLGHRDVFQVDAYGVAVYPGPPPGEIEGEWTFQWRVTSPDGSEATEGEVHYTVDPAADPVPRETPPPCVAEGGTATASPEPGHETATTEPGATDEPDGGAVDEDDDGPDILLLALLTTGAAGAAALIALIGYFVRRAVGFDPHRPGSGGGDHR
jgi:hypothetical protein